MLDLSIEVWSFFIFVIGVNLKLFYCIVHARHQTLKSFEVRWQPTVSSYLV